LIVLGVTARFAVRTGCTARRTLRGTSILLKKPILIPRFRWAVQRGFLSHP
jgi:hypothetical protein